MAVMNWLQDQARCYIGNAQTKRDLRTQLRGNRAIWLWSFYLFFLVLVAGFSYNQMVGRDGMYQSSDISSMQQSLKTLYTMMLTTLSVMMGLIAPALTAAAITTERQRRSLDLVFSAPVSPKYLLVGKILSTYRYVWMLLVLSLPFTAVAVVLGGATAWDVFTTYTAQSFVGLIYSAIGLMISSVTYRPVLAIIYSYLSVILYTIMVTTVSGVLVAPMLYRTYAGGAQLPDWMGAVIMLSGGASFQSTAGVTTTLGSLVLFIVAALFLVKLLLSGAGSALVSRAGKETAALRIQCLLLIGLLALAASFSWQSGLGASVPKPEDIVRTSFFALLTLMLFLPMITCYGTDGPNRYMNDGVIRFRTMFTGTPAGALPYVLLCVAMAVAPAFWMGTMNAQAGAMIAYTFGWWIFFWGIGRFWSRSCRSLAAARGAHFVTMMTLVGLPDVFASAAGINPSERYSTLLYPISSGNLDMGAAYGVGFALAGALLAWLSRKPRPALAKPPVVRA